MDENAAPRVPFLERKSATHKQILGGTALAMVLYMMPGLKGLFYTREEGVAVVDRVSRTEVALSSMENRITDKMNRNTDKIIDRIKETEERTMKNADRIERRIDGVEVVQRMSPQKRTTN